MNRSIWGLLSLSIGIFLLSGCGLSPNEPGVQNQGVHTQLSDSVVLSMVGKTDRTAYVKTTNHSGVKTMNCLTPVVRQQLRAEGFQIVDHPSQAHFIIEPALLRIGVTSLDAANSILLQGFQGRVKTAGRIALGHQPYNEIAAYSRPGYIVVVDLTIQQKTATGKEHYTTRLVSFYSHRLNPVHFSAVQGAFCQSIARMIATLFVMNS